MEKVFLFVITVVAALCIAQSTMADEGICKQPQLNRYQSARCASPIEVEFLFIQIDQEPTKNRDLILGLASNQNLLPRQEILVSNYLADFSKVKEVARWSNKAIKMAQR